MAGKKATDWIVAHDCTKGVDAMAMELEKMP